MQSERVDAALAYISTLSQGEWVLLADWLAWRDTIVETFAKPEID